MVCLNMLKIMMSVINMKMWPLFLAPCALTLSYWHIVVAVFISKKKMTSHLGLIVVDNRIE